MFGFGVFAEGHGGKTPGNHKEFIDSDFLSFFPTLQRFKVSILCQFGKGSPAEAEIQTREASALRPVAPFPACRNPTLNDVLGLSFISSPTPNSLYLERQPMNHPQTSDIPEYATESRIQLQRERIAP